MMPHLNAIRGMALTVKRPLEEFVENIGKYKRAMQSNGCWHEVGRKVQWVVGLKEDIDRFRATMTMKIVINSILLAMGYVGFYSLLTLL